MAAWPELTHWFDPSSGLPPLTPDAGFVIRRWAELAFWFQPLSAPAGQTWLAAHPENGPTDSDQTVVNCNFGSVGGQSLGGFTSHTYITSLHSWTTWPLYVELAAETGSGQPSTRCSGS